MASARNTAFSVLLKMEKEGSYSNLALDEALRTVRLSEVEKRLATALVYGVCERKLTLDFNLSLYLSSPIKKLKKDVLTCLRLGAYRIFFMEKIPDSAAVNESVKLSKTFRFSYASKMVNAVLRKCSDNGLKIPDESDNNYLSVKYSCSQNIVDLFVSQYGFEDAEKILSFGVGIEKTFIRVNTTKTDSQKLTKLLEKEGVCATKTSVENSLEIEFCGKSVTGLESFRNGLFHVRDLSSRLCALATKAKGENIVFDLCAAPGGKSFSIAEMMNGKGEVRSFDIHPHRVKLIQNGAKRLGLSNIKAYVGDATKFDESLGKADIVLCDVPCSGLGIIGRKPEIKYKSAKEIDELSEIRLSILSCGSKYVKNGGRLVYSTCSLNKNENEAVCEKFLFENKNFSYTSVFENDEGFKTFLPFKDNCDGFFVACFEKND